MTLEAASQRRVCRLLGICRSTARSVPRETTARPVALDEDLVAKLSALIQSHPTFGYRRLWALLRRDGLRVNRKKVVRSLRLKRWLAHHRKVTPRPRVQASRSRTEASNLRWAMDITHIACGQDGWAHLVAVIDSHDREIIG